ncbi:hypothetical protein QEZ54_08470 [Catellatospora sp. KI3]|uniref:hypothetical protein n=1 Tax=Catellatospora sp. KI3 TaxID=3041620 RepID=UPI002482236D|nr:hypothetical protein [Catellatospora sp. KI3]MDI1460995.1 hypothetical protein [Catellatospora sp. KI3]
MTAKMITLSAAVPLSAVYRLDLSCGHRTTVAVSGVVPVVLGCCDRLGLTDHRDSRGLPIPVPGAVVGATHLPGFVASASGLKVVHRDDHEQR